MWLNIKGLFILSVILILDLTTSSMTESKLDQIKETEVGAPKTYNLKALLRKYYNKLFKVFLKDKICNSNIDC